MQIPKGRKYSIVQVIAYLLLHNYSPWGHSATCHCLAEVLGSDEGRVAAETQTSKAISKNL